ncbi:MAG TPA: hypothetical protein VK489_11435 [Ferruginibacter sp.]|nr:hypothetical protein [Ferruginibacter sp.]
MPDPKKIFFSYSDEAEDTEFYKKIHKHFAIYTGNGKLGIIDKATVFAIAGDEAQVLELLKKSDIAIPLLSIDFVNDEKCLGLLKTAALNNIKIVPVFLRDFDLTALPELSNYRKHILLDDTTPLEKHIRAGDKDDDTVFKEIALRVKALVYPEIGDVVIQRSSNTFYYIIASVVMVLGIVVSVIVYHETEGLAGWEQLSFTALCFLMFACIGFISLKNVLFPNKVQIKR